MKWIILAGSSDTRKTFTLSELVIALVTHHGARLISPTILPVLHPASSQTSYPFYADDSYELIWNNKKIVVVTDGDMPSSLDDALAFANRCSADVLVSASRAKSGSGHIKRIDAVVTSGAIDVYIVAALDHSRAVYPAIIANRIDQIIRLV